VSLLHFDPVSGGTVEPNRTGLELITNPAAYTWQPNAVNIFCYEVPRYATPPYDFGARWMWFGCSSGPASSLGTRTSCLLPARLERAAPDSARVRPLFRLDPHLRRRRMPEGQAPDKVAAGDDLVLDTLPRRSVGRRTSSPTTTTSDLPPTGSPERELVDNTFWNLESYHGGLPGTPRTVDNTRITEGQLDRFADFASATDFSRAVTSGATLFVGGDHCSDHPDGRSACTLPGVVGRSPASRRPSPPPTRTGRHPGSAARPLRRAVADQQACRVAPAPHKRLGHDRPALSAGGRTATHHCMNTPFMVPARGRTMSAIIALAADCCWLARPPQPTTWRALATVTWDVGWSRGRHPSARRPPRPVRRHPGHAENHPEYDRLFFGQPTA